VEDDGEPLEIVVHHFQEYLELRVLKVGQVLVPPIVIDILQVHFNVIDYSRVRENILIGNLLPENFLGIEVELVLLLLRQSDRSTKKNEFAFLIKIEEQGITGPEEVLIES
jgi:hypothetical protein